MSPQPPHARELEGAKRHAAGTIFVAPDGDILLLCRARDGGNYQGYWALPGGGVDDGETVETAVDRENAEELGGAAPKGSRRVLDRRMTPEGNGFHTFAQAVPEKFTPRLNPEHTGYAWVAPHMAPSPLHPGVQATLSERLGVGQDMTSENWAQLRDNFLKWLSEEEAEPEHAEDESLAFDRMSIAVMAGAPERECFAFDRASVRTETADGRMAVDVSNISKANVCPYLGREIPRWKELGLEPERIYQLLRDPEELEKAAHTFNDLPVLSEHVAVTADRHRPDLVVGTTGSKAEFKAPYLRNGLVIWTRDGIDAINSGAKRQLSSAYRYRADMTPGVFQGQRYDGVMRDIVGNHVALVKDGRAGDDVVVGDSKEGILMAKSIILTRKASLLNGALAVNLLPLLAKDAKLDLTPGLATATAKSLREKPKDFAAAIHKIALPLIAADKKLSLDEVEKVIDLVNKYDDPAETGTKDAMETDPNSGAPMVDPATTVDADPMAKLKSYLSGILSPEQMAEVESMCSTGAQDADDPDDGPLMQPPGAKDEFPPKKDGDDKDEKDKKDMAKDARPVGITKVALDAALKQNAEEVRKATIAEQNAIQEARRRVAPLVGELHMSFDSAEAVLRHVLTVKGNPRAATMHADALSDVVDNMVASIGKRPTPPLDLGMDSASVADFNKRFPHAAAIRQI